MPKTSAIQKNESRKRLVEKYAKVRAELKAVLANPATTDEQFFAAQTKLQKLPKNSSKIRIRNRCSMSGRPRGFKRKYGVSRIQFRELALAGKIPGVIKSSW
jgi:small subunit ribosomal protein S14